MEKYGQRETGSGKTVVIDYSSPNIAKHLAFHHLRSAVIGNALKNIFRCLGFHVVGINHLGDWGTQFGKLITAFKKWGPPGEDLGENPVSLLNDLYVRFQKESKENPELIDEGRNWFRKLEEGNCEARNLWQKFREVSLQTFDRVYDRLGITFDQVRGESDYIQDTDKILEQIAQKGLSKRSEGALIVDLSEFNMPPCLLKKADEATLYATRDICAAIDRYQKNQFTQMLYVVDTGQSLHFQQFFKVLELMGCDWVQNMQHVNFGIIKFAGTKTRTREGNIILLEEVLDEAVKLIATKIKDKNPDLKNQDRVSEQVGIGAIIFADLSGRRMRDVNFVWEEILNFDGRTGPYLQYSYARAQSILRKATQGDRKNLEDANFDLLILPEEWQLIRNLAQFPQAVQNAAKDCEPSYIADRLLDICECFHRYHACGKNDRTQRVLAQDEATRRARLALTHCTTQVLKAGLSLLGMAAPLEM
jgi:arginyl-tRNA synthetase